MIIALLARHKINWVKNVLAGYLTKTIGIKLQALYHLSNVDNSPIGISLSHLFGKSASAAQDENIYMSSQTCIVT